MTSTQGSLLPPSATVYKGKIAHRSWPQLPEEIVRLITTHFLWDLSATSYCPQTWENRRQWYSRMAYTCIRDTLDLEKYIMSICPEWRRAVETHLFWNQAINVLDPNDVLLFHMVIHPKPPLNASSNAPQAPIYLTPYQHLRNILNSTCLVCRINYPLSNTGLANAKRLIPNTYLGPIPICRDHDRRRTTFCGLCLRDTPILHPQDTTSRDYELSQSIGIVENEDDDTWPNVESTCRKCRTEWLWRKASTNPRDVEAIGGPSMQSADWETRQNVDSFIELAEGTINDVIVLAREKFWLRRYTKYDSLGQHLLAASRSEPRSARRGEEEEEEEDSEEDRELMLMRGSPQVRDLALQDWCRQRILDGHWFSPADTWYQNVMPDQPTAVPTVHPCPWARELDGESAAASVADISHPLEATVKGEVPPSYGMCEQAFIVHMKQMREILGPALRNVVRKVVMECSVPVYEGDDEEGVEGGVGWNKGGEDGSGVRGGQGRRMLGYEDPTRRVGRMSMEEIVRILREEEGVWYDGVDWLEKRRNEEEANARRRQAERDREHQHQHELNAHRHPRKEDDSDSTSSSSHESGKSLSLSLSSSSSTSNRGSASSNSNGTSPVLSTTTLQTTPSPPPLPLTLSLSEDSGATSIPAGGTGGGPHQKEGDDKSDVQPQPLQQLHQSTVQDRKAAHEGSNQTQTQTQHPQQNVQQNPHQNPHQNFNPQQNPKPKRIYLPAPRTIPIDPVRSTPRLLSKIPYVPVTTAHMPHYSMEALKGAWREACGPLYHCCCSVCERAKITELNARAAANGHNGALQASIAPPQPVQPTLRTTIYPPSVRGGEIELKEIHGVDLDAEGEGEEEVDYDASDFEYDEDEEEDEEDFYDEDDEDGQRVPYDTIISYSDPSPPSLPLRPSSGEPRARPRKRSSDELLDEDDYDGVEDATATTGRTGTGTEDDDSAAGGISPTTTLRKLGYRSQGGTPPKRARIGGEDGEDGRPRSLSSSVGSDGEERPRYQYYAQLEKPIRQSPPTQHQSQPQSPGRHRKRNSEELDDADADIHVPPHHQGKRVRTEDVIVGSGTRSSPLLVASPDDSVLSSSSLAVELLYGMMREVNEEFHRP